MEAETHRDKGRNGETEESRKTRKGKETEREVESEGCRNRKRGQFREAKRSRGADRRGERAAKEIARRA